MHMKHTLITLITCAALIHAATAAEPVIVVQSVTRVTVDGRDFGKPVDAIANNRQHAAGIQRALEAWAAGIIAERDAAKANAAAATTQAAAELARMTTVIDAAKGAASTQAARAAVEGLADALRKPEIEQRKEALAKEIAVKQAELAKLDADAKAKP